MPTQRPRITVTETDALAAALDDAAQRWPQDRDARSRLLVRLVEQGCRALAQEQETSREERTTAVRQTAGTLTDCFPDGYLDTLREDWPT